MTYVNGVVPNLSPEVSLEKRRRFGGNRFERCHPSPEYVAAAEGGVRPLRAGTRGVNIDHWTKTCLKIWGYFHVRLLLPKANNG